MINRSDSSDDHFERARWLIFLFNHVRAGSSKLSSTAGGLLGCVAIGAMFSLPVFLRPISRDTGWSITGVSGAMTVGFVAMAFGSIIWGSLSDRFGPRPIVITGSCVLAAGLALLSRATSLIQFQLTFGLVVGGATAAIFAPMMACVTGWFDTHRSLAVSLAFPPAWEWRR